MRWDRLLGQGHEEIGEGDVLALDGDGHRQVEPVPVVGREPPRLHQRCVDDLPVVGHGRPPASIVRPSTAGTGREGGR